MIESAAVAFTIPSNLSLLFDCSQSPDLRFDVVVKVMIFAPPDRVGGFWPGSRLVRRSLLADSLVMIDPSIADGSALLRTRIRLSPGGLEKFSPG
ncbi:hypothetical protein ASF84_13715 [Pseudomonas sp. Leaf127]|nr:hypothetical protein ASF84_13715 [Pseudomonas sp. Leaf127]